MGPKVKKQKDSGGKDAKKSGWRGKLEKDLRLMGHRNWIVIADAAYPAQSNPGIKTVITGSSQIEAVSAVLEIIDAAPHVRPILYVDSELQHVAESDAPGVEAYRAEIGRALDGRAFVAEPHEKIIEKLDEAGKVFRVLILKTDLTIPYTSVFVNLDCGYWSAEAEGRLRDAIENPEAEKTKLEKPKESSPMPQDSPWKKQDSHDK